MNGAGLDPLFPQLSPVEFGGWGVSRGWTWVSSRVFRVFRGYISRRGGKAGRHGDVGQSGLEICEIE